MFEGSLVESTPLLRTGSRWPAIVSFSAQAAILAILIAIPLLHPEVVALHAPKLTSLAPPPRPPQPPPPPRPIHVEATTSSAPAAPSMPTQPAVSQPTITSDLTPVDAPPLPVSLNIGPARPNLPGAILSSAPASPNVATAPSTGTATSAKPLNISSGVIAGLLLAPIRPEYPPIARASHTFGAVVIQAIISKSGHIESAHVVSGNPMLQGAALQAVRDARYRPYLLNGQPTEVETTITINFTLGN